MINTKIAIFKGKQIRKTIYKNEWWFVIVDVVAALTDSVQPDGYIKDMRRRDSELSKGWGQIATPVPVRRNLQSQFWDNSRLVQKVKRIKAGKSPRSYG